MNSPTAMIACHRGSRSPWGAGRPGSTVQGTAAPSFGAIAGRPNQTSQRLQSFIMTPHRPMPGIPLSLAEVNDVVAYILSLK